ncbi:MAG: fumarylacetoacetate hydrolase family protein [Thermoleophilia bacterium]|nr:fumarylacetoacetate hydrolase family protein [Thermoleophilia bacterium]
MRLVSFEGGFGRVEGDLVVPLGNDLVAYLEGLTAERARAAAAETATASAAARPATTSPIAAAATPASEAHTAAATVTSSISAAPLSSLRLRAPVSRPGKVVCIGLNYRDHAAESGQVVPEVPVLFPKFANSVIGPGEAIVIPSGVEMVDYEAELGVVIGRRCARVGREDALSYVGGYLCANDVSARSMQRRISQWLWGKAIDTFLPTGPWLVTADEIPDPQALSIRCWVSGELMQESSTAQMVFTVADLVSHISRTMTLEPGDLIVTGTPAGVGFARRPPRWLVEGDQVTVEIDGIGALTNPVAREGA